jgi:hypothetical protein
MSGSCGQGDDSSGSGAKELVNVRGSAETVSVCKFFRPYISSLKTFNSFRLNVVDCSDSVVIGRI